MTTEDAPYLTLVYRTSPEARARLKRGDFSAASWSHALHERDAALAALTLVQAERDELQREVSGLHAAADQFLDERDTARQAYADACKCLTAVNGERDAMQQERDELRARLARLDNLPAEDFIRKVAKQMGPTPFDTWPVSHVCQQNADEAAELVEAYDDLRAVLTPKATPTPEASEASEASRGR